jgi:SAM-dependent methyltransferase
MVAAAEPDKDAVALFAFRVWSYKQGELVSLLIHLGDRLGLYRALAEVGETTSADLAVATGLHERWVREWLRGNAAADLIASDDGLTFALAPEARPVLVDEDSSVSFAAGAFGAPLDPSVVDELADAFRTGVGLPYDRLGPSGAHRTERMLGPWARIALVPTIVPALDGVHDKLERGALVADVGCGAGVALDALARAYPKSTFHGFELSTHAIDRARTRLGDLDNVELHLRRAEELPAGAGYDLVLTFDCLHDMTQPMAALQSIRGAVADDGTLLVKDIRSTGDWRADRRNPMLAMMFGFSVSSCMSSALSEPGGAGLGTLGFNATVAEDMSRAAGFTSFRVHDFEEPANLYYEVRP